MSIKLMRYLSIAFLLFTLSSVYAESPNEAVERSANELMASLERNKSQLKTNPQLVEKLIRQHIIPQVDVVGMSRSVLGRGVWSKATKEQKREFSHEFMQLIIRTYSQGVKNYSGETIKFFPVRKGNRSKRFASVSSMIIVPNGKRIPLKYRLVKKRSGWKVYDISVEGVSLLQSFRTQFSAELKKGTTLDELIVKVRQKKLRKRS